MKNVDSFCEAITTLLYSWGGDTPPEATWAANELLKWAEEEYGVKFEREFLELDEHLDWVKAHPNEEDYHDVLLEEIKTKLSRQ